MAQKRIINIFFEGLKIYCLNIHKFLMYMAFPVLGQLAGIILTFTLVYWYSQNIQNIIVKFPVLNDMTMLLLFVLALSIPGLIIFMKAFWDYLVAYGAINSMTEGYLNTGKVYDFKSHREVVLNKTFSFIIVWLMFSLFVLISLIPVFWIIGFIFFIYFILIFQVFTFENGLSPLGYFRRSFEIVKGNFIRTLILAITLFIFTFYLLPLGLNVIFDALNINQTLAKFLEGWAFTLPIEKLEPYGVTPMLISKSVVGQISAFLVISFTLPFRSICWTLWYNSLADSESKSVEPKKKSKSKKTKNFKIEKREIDPEIIRRARLEDDEY